MPSTMPAASTFHGLTRSSSLPPTIWASPIDRKLAVTISETSPRLTSNASCQEITKLASEPRAP